MSEVIHSSDFASEAAGFILDAVREGLANADRFTLSLSGGNTPRPVYERMAVAGDIDWDRVIVTFGDERCVPADDPASNYRMANEALISRARIPEAHVLRMRGECEPVGAAREYEAKLHALAGTAPFFRHDLMILGLGEDGHTASLFPGSDALDENSRWVVETPPPKPGPARLTMTFPIINAARQVVFLAAGENKKPVVDAVLSGNPDPPASRVRPGDGEVVWILGW